MIFKKSAKPTNTFLDYGAKHSLASEYPWFKNEKMYLI